MLKQERHEYILKQIALHSKVLSSDLSITLNVSEDTIRRDLNELALKGRIIKVFGGALSKSFNYPFQQPQVYAREEKRRIASKALGLLGEGMSVLAGGGTVMIELAKKIPENLKGTFFTVSPLVALEVAERSTMDVILLAGRLSRNSYVCTGSAVIGQLSELRVDLCLMGTNGICVKAGITDYDWEVAQIKKAMVRCAQKTALLSISEKLGSQQKIQVCHLNSIDYLITELNPVEKRLARYSKSVKLI
jgi:DeoR/GlpR family transcriptional regulator of sugar metabolism